VPFVIKLGTHKAMAIFNFKFTIPPSLSKQNIAAFAAIFL